MKVTDHSELVAKFFIWATGAMLALCMYIASDALTKLEQLDTRVDTHETRITVLEKS